MDNLLLCLSDVNTMLLLEFEFFLLKPLIFDVTFFKIKLESLNFIRKDHDLFLKIVHVDLVNF